MLVIFLTNVYGCTCLNFFIVISEPDDVTVCNGTASTSLSCVLNGNISSDDVQWYRLVKGTNTAQRVSKVDDFVDVPIPGQNRLTAVLYIYNARRSYTGYYWVRSPLGDVCNTSFTVSTGVFVVNSPKFFTIKVVAGF